MELTIKHHTKVFDKTDLGAMKIALEKMMEYLKINNKPGHLIVDLDGTRSDNAVAEYDNLWDGPFYMIRANPSCLFHTIDALAHEMIHFKQALLDGLRVNITDGRNGKGHYIYKGERFEHNISRKAKQKAHGDLEVFKKHVPWEKEAYERQDEVMKAAMDALPEEVRKHIEGKHCRLHDNDDNREGILGKLFSEALSGTPLSDAVMKKILKGEKPSKEEFTKANAELAVAIRKNLEENEKAA